MQLLGVYSRFPGLHRRTWQFRLNPGREPRDIPFDQIKDWRLKVDGSFGIAGELQPGSHLGQRQVWQVDNALKVGTEIRLGQ